MSMREVAKHLEAMGRHGDTALVHMSPQEVSALHGIASINGTHLTTNPHTGLPEAFSLGGFFKSLLPTIVGAVAAPLTGGTSMLIPVMAGAATGAALNGKDPLMGALMGGLGGFGGAGIGNALSAGSTASTAAQGANTVSNAATAAENAIAATPNVTPAFGGAGEAMGTTTSFGVPSEGITQVQQLAGQDAAARSLANSAMQAPAPTGLASLGTSAGRDAFVKSLGGTGPNADLIAAGKVAMPLGMAGLAGIEPPQMPQEKEDKYDPYATLNLNTDSGLRFFAEGGDVKNVQSASGPPALRDAVNRINNSPNPVASALLGNFDTNSLRSSPNPGVDLFRAMTMGVLGRMGDINNMYRPESLGLFAKDSGARFAEGGDVNETPDPGSNPIQDAQEARSYGIGGLSYADGGEIFNGPSLNLGTAGGANFNNSTPGKYSPAQFEQMYNAYNQNRNLMSSFMVNPTKRPEVSPEQAQFNKMMQQSGPRVGGDPFGNLLYGRKLSDEQKAFNQQLQGYNKARTDYYKQQSPLKGFGGIYGGGAGTGGVGFSKPLNIWQGNTAMPSAPGPFAGSSGAKFAKGGYLDGPGDGMSDSIPASIEGKQPARLADGEFVVPADVVSHLGNGSTKAGAERLYAMMDKVRHARTGTTKQGRQINPKKYLPA